MRSYRKRFMSPTRRQALGMAGTCGALAAMRGPIEALLTGLVEGVIQTARAQGNVKPRNYIHLNLSGGPCRWFFDLPLRPYANSGDFVQDPQIITRFNSQGVGEYHTLPVTVNGVTLNMPTLWSSAIPTSTGSWVPMTVLLDHMAMIRGVNMQADGHPANNFKQVRPTQSMPSLTGMVADLSEAPIPAVGASPGTPYSVYKSSRAIGQVVLTQMEGNKNPLASILGSFDTRGDKLPAPFVTRRKALEAATHQALDALGAYAKSTQPGAENLFSLRSKAESLMRQGIGDLQTIYDTLYKKYWTLVQLCKTRDVPGVTDKPILPSSFPRMLCRTFVNDGGRRLIANNADLRDTINAETKLEEMVEGFAVAEYLITQGYSSTVLWGCLGVTKMVFDNPATVQLDGAGNETGQTPIGMSALKGGMTNDEHFTGNAISLVGNTFMFRSIAACLYELICVLKNANLFSETVIQLGAEFSRVPRRDFAGSEHGWMANCTTIFCGAIDRPIVIGNIGARGTPLVPDFETTWGAAAAIEVDGTAQTLTIGHSTSTVAHLLRVAPPLPNNGPLFVEGSSGINPTVELARNK